MNPHPKVKGPAAHYSYNTMSILKTYDKMRPEIVHPIRRKLGCWWTAMNNEEVRDKL